MINIDCRSTTFILPRMFRQNLGEVPCLLCRANKLIPTKRVIGTEMSTFSCEYALHWHWDSPFCMSRELCLRRKSPPPFLPPNFSSFSSPPSPQSKSGVPIAHISHSLTKTPFLPSFLDHRVTRSSTVSRSQSVGRPLPPDLCVREISFYLSASSEFAALRAGFYATVAGSEAEKAARFSNIVQKLRN